MHTAARSILGLVLLTGVSFAQSNTKPPAGFDWRALEPVVESVLKSGNGTLARYHKNKLRDLLSSEISKQLANPSTRTALATLTHQIGRLAGGHGNYIEAVKWMELSRFLKLDPKVEADLLAMQIKEARTVPTVDDLRSAVYDVPVRRSLVKFRDPKARQTPIGTQPATGNTDPTAIKVEFHFDRADLTELAQQKAKVIGDFLATQQASQFTLIGHTDEVGTEAYNQTLSQRRAAAVAAFITDKCNVPASKIRTVGKGKSEPRWPGATSGDKAEQNRRVELVL